MILRFLVGVFVLICGSSCESSSVSEDVAKFCECQSDRINVENDSKCDQIMEEIVIKYEFDPEALVEIQQLLQECN